jgi:hypothetical protein
MKQQVNLYQLRLQPTKPVLPGSTVLGACALGLLSLLLVYGHACLQAWMDTRRLESLSVQRAEAEQRLAELHKTHPSGKTERQLQATIQQLEASRDAKIRLLRLLSNHSLGNTAGFSRHVAALARQRVPGLWLREIRIHQGGGQLALAGSALEAELVPRLIQQLGGEEIFSGSDFESFRLQRLEAESEPIDFFLSTDEEPSP